ncbi:hypothetical protein EDD85DRAFT_139180 [Armillaria nabsnona]|nr:hypothetical protein EDD85DRAFT_139180 [Armillaria nabsnona]
MIQGLSLEVTTPCAGPTTMDTPCPANIRELLTFLPARPPLHPDARYSTSTAIYSAQNFAPPQKRPLCCRPYPEKLPELKNFFGGVVNDLGIGDISCQSMQGNLQHMSEMSFMSEADVSLYGGRIVSAIDPIVQAIAKAAGLPGRTSVLCEAVGRTAYSQRGDFNITVRRRWPEDGQVRQQRVLVCSDEDNAYSVLLSKAKDFSRPLKLDATKEQTNAKAMAVKLALQMVTAGADWFFLCGFIAIVAQLVQSIDPSHPGTILLLSPVFKLQNETLPDSHRTKRLTPFQANIPTEPFIAIIVAMLRSNMFPQHGIKSPPHDLCQPLTLDTIPDADETESDVEGAVDHEENTGGSSDIPTIDLQVATNAMIMYHPWLNSSDIHRISVIGLQSILAAENSTPLKRSLSSLQPRYLLHAPRFPSTNVDVVTLIDEIGVSRWSSVWKCRVEGDAKLRIMKLVA